jgi:hypothetical protein
MSEETVAAPEQPVPTAQEEAAMEIHPPKVWHGWREFLKEYAIIVLGVLTALVAEQAVASLHQHLRAAEARASIRAEIARNLGSMEARHAGEACMAKRLDEVEALIAASSVGKLPQETLWIGGPSEFLILDGKYKTAVQSGTVSLFDDKEQAAYADLYLIFADYWQRSGDEIRIWTELRTLEKHPPPSPVLDWHLRSALQQARMARFLIGLGRWGALRGAADIGVAPATQGKFGSDLCLPLNTTRKEAEKLSPLRGLDLPIP